MAKVIKTQLLGKEVLLPIGAEPVSVGLENVLGVPTPYVYSLLKETEKSEEQLYYFEMARAEDEVYENVLAKRYLGHFVKNGEVVHVFHVEY